MTSFPVNRSRVSIYIPPIPDSGCVKTNFNSSVFLPRLRIWKRKWTSLELSVKNIERLKLGFGIRSCNKTSIRRITPELTGRDEQTQAEIDSSNMKSIQSALRLNELLARTWRIQLLPFLKPQQFDNQRGNVRICISYLSDILSIIFNRDGRKEYFLVPTNGLQHTSI